MLEKLLNYGWSYCSQLQHFHVINIFRFPCCKINNCKFKASVLVVALFKDLESRSLEQSAC